MCAVCEFKIDFGVSHPSALSVAVAARKAIESGLIAPIEASEGALSAARLRMASVETLNRLQARIEEAHSEDTLLTLPDFYVLLIENDTWGFFHATTEGFDPDIVPEIPDVAATDESKRSHILIMSEAALHGWLDGKFDTLAALRDSLFMVDAPEAATAALKQMLATAEASVVA